MASALTTKVEAFAKRVGNGCVSWSEFSNTSLLNKPTSTEHAMSRIRVNSQVYAHNYAFVTAVCCVVVMLMHPGELIVCACVSLMVSVVLGTAQASNEAIISVWVVAMLVLFWITDAGLTVIGGFATGGIVCGLHAGLREPDTAFMYA